MAGLSPRTRGKPIRGYSHLSRFGPIPADAGETRRWVSRVITVRAYPRGRGGNATSSTNRHRVTGLSPRTRGKLFCIQPRAASAGPIPADAGETWSCAARWRCGGAYPRGRGGNRCPVRCGDRLRGLSPRTRGKHQRGQSPHHRRGPIPADAGETLTVTPVMPAERAYPRGRGGNHSMPGNPV